MELKVRSYVSGVMKCGGELVELMKGSNIVSRTSRSLINEPSHEGSQGNSDAQMTREHKILELPHPFRIVLFKTI